MAKRAKTVPVVSLTALSVSNALKRIMFRTSVVARLLIVGHDVGVEMARGLSASPVTDATARPRRNQYHDRSASSGHFCSTMAHNASAQTVSGHLDRPSFCAVNA